MAEDCLRDFRENEPSLDQFALRQSVRFGVEKPWHVKRVKGDSPSVSQQK